MARATVTSKGQITLPKEVRDQLGVTAGDRVAFVSRPDGSIVIEAATRDLGTLCGAIQPARQGVTIDDMNAAIRARVRR